MEKSTPKQTNICPLCKTPMICDVKLNGFMWVCKCGFKQFEKFERNK